MKKVPMMSSGPVASLVCFKSFITNIIDSTTNLFKVHKYTRSQSVLKFVEADSSRPDPKFTAFFEEN